MTNETKQDNATADFERLLETYGADRRRWPAGTAARLDVDAHQDDPVSQRLVIEARALDAVLDRAKVTSSKRDDALLDRIMREAERQPQHAARSTNVTPLRVKRQSVFREHGPALTALAASLVLGVLAGTSMALQPLAEAVAAAAVGGGDTQQIAVAGEAETGLDEDLL